MKTGFYLVPTHLLPEQDDQPPPNGPLLLDERYCYQARHDAAEYDRVINPIGLTDNSFGRKALIADGLDGSDRRCHRNIRAD